MVPFFCSRILNTNDMEINSSAWLCLAYFYSIPLRPAQTLTVPSCASTAVKKQSTRRRRVGTGYRVLLYEIVTTYLHKPWRLNAGRLQRNTFYRRSHLEWEIHQRAADRERKSKRTFDFRQASEAGNIKPAAWRQIKT